MNQRYFRILLIDDDEDDYILTRGLIEETGGRVRLDWNALYDVALETIGRHEHDVYLVDYHLGERNGLDLLREAIATGCRAPIIVLTGQGDEEIGIAALQAGAADYLVKARMDAQLLERAIRYAFERKRAEEARLQLFREQSARAEAEAAVRTRDQFLSIAAHELKTPLTSLLGNIQLLQRRAQREYTLNERDQKMLRVIGDQTLRLSRMIEALLDISRIETGQLSIVRQPMDLRQLALRVVDEIRPSIEHHTLDIHSADAPLIIEGDELRLEQVLQNLIQNAIKYSPKGGPITVTLARDQDLACIAVRDRGIGIPEEAIPRLFQRFYRVPNAGAHQIHGIGVGLFVVAEIVRMHQGTVKVVSREGEGSVFICSFPLAHPPAAETPYPDPEIDADLTLTHTVEG
jgi:signal transduction histidine kinase